jgi:hypothetical protein
VEERQLIGAAARNNAEWCQLFCRAHGIEGIFDEDRWYSRSRTPPLYPDVVTLRPGLDAEQALAGVDRGPGCSVKDSFADLQLEDVGFRELFVAEWILRRDPLADPGSGWCSIATEDALAKWEAAWDDEPGDEPFFPSSLLGEPGVVFLAQYDDDAISAGALANRSGNVVGLSNVFASSLDLAKAYVGASAMVAGIWPGLPIVGYDHGDPLAAARAAGFESIGLLRVWIS